MNKFALTAAIALILVTIIFSGCAQIKYHYECSGTECKQVFGEGPDTCYPSSGGGSEDECFYYDCEGTECEKKAKLPKEPITNTCDPNKQGENDGDGTNKGKCYNLECENKECIKKPKNPGVEMINACKTEAQTGSDPAYKCFYMGCEGTECKSQPKRGQDLQPDLCNPEDKSKDCKHLDCEGSVCKYTEYEGIDNCDSKDAHSCQHLECMQVGEPTDWACEWVDGKGENQCETQGSSEECTYKACEGTSCVQYYGSAPPGTVICESDDNCKVKGCPKNYDTCQTLCPTAVLDVFSKASKKMETINLEFSSVTTWGGTATETCLWSAGGEQQGIVHGFIYCKKDKTTGELSWHFAATSGERCEAKYEPGSICPPDKSKWDGSCKSCSTSCSQAPETIDLKVVVNARLACGRTEDVLETLTFTKYETTESCYYGANNTWTNTPELCADGICNSIITCNDSSEGIQWRADYGFDAYCQLETTDEGYPGQPTPGCVYGLPQRTSCEPFGICDQYFDSGSAEGDFACRCLGQSSTCSP